MSDSFIIKLVNKHLMLCLLLISNLFANRTFADDSAPLAILGGQGNAPYAAFLHADGSVVTLEGLPPTGLTYRVAINSSGHGIVGGTDNVNAYAALVSPDGIVHPITGLISPGEIYFVAINQAGNGIIGGGHQMSNVPYAALVSKDGVATSLALPPSGLIYGVTIDSSGEGIMGGQGPLNSAYAALVSPTGTVTPLAGLPSTGGIFWVASNDSKTRFIGGQENTSVYAAFVEPNGTLAPIAGLPSGVNYSVALNASGNAIMGGKSLDLPYAALVARDGTVTTLSGLPTSEGIIYNVTLNTSGTGLIAGYSAAGPYGSFVAPDGALTPLIGLPAGTGFLDGAALHETGIGIVGGTTYNTPFAALVAPNGQLTYLSGLPSNGQINSIGISILDNLVPKSIGPFDSWANTQFAMSDALTQHSLFHQNVSDCSCCNQYPTMNFDLNDGCSSVWAAMFGNYVNEKSHHSIPDVSNHITGGLVGYDYRGVQDVVFGGALAYAYNSVRYSRSSGRAAINQESAVIYATWNKPCFYINAALWGGLFQANNKRRSLGFITSKASPSGWNLSPHLEIGTPFRPSCNPCIVIDPFISIDWAFNRQTHYRERGASGFNIRLKDQSASILRSELGLRFFETFQYDWGQLILEEKVSYVNRSAIHKGKGRATFIGAASSFDVETLSSSSQNQGNVQLHLECIPSCLESVYASIDYQGGFGSLYQSHMLTLGVGKDF